MEPLALSINDTANALGLGRTSIYAMIADGRLEAFRLGRRDWSAWSRSNGS